MTDDIRESGMLTNTCIACGEVFDLPLHTVHGFEDSTIHVFSCPRCNAVFHHHEVGVDMDADIERCRMALEYVERVLGQWNGRFGYE